MTMMGIGRVEVESRNCDKKKRRKRQTIFPENSPSINTRQLAPNPGKPSPAITSLADIVNPFNKPGSNVNFNRDRDSEDCKDSLEVRMTVISSRYLFLISLKSS